MCRVLTNSQLFEKFSAFYDTWNFPNASKRAYLPPFPILNQISAVHDSLSHTLKINFNVILPSKPRSSKWPLSLGSPQQNSLCIFPAFLLHAPLIWDFLIWSHEQYLVTYTDHEALRYAGFSIPLVRCPIVALIRPQHPIYDYPWPCSFLIVRYQVPYRHKTTGNVFHYEG